MCGKFTSLKSWREAISLAEDMTLGREQLDDQIVAYRVMSAIPVIIRDREEGRRRVVPMRWGFPSPQDWRRPQPIHARAESIEETKAFAQAFKEGQRGIVLVKTFNEAPDIEGPTIQHTISLGDMDAAGIALVWRRFDLKDTPMPMLAACMVTVPANKLISSLPTDRMPAVLDAADWPVWLGEREATADEIKSCLQTKEEPSWSLAKEERPRRKPTVSDPHGLL